MGGGDFGSMGVVCLGVPARQGICWASCKA